MRSDKTDGRLQLQRVPLTCLSWQRRARLRVLAPGIDSYLEEYTPRHARVQRSSLKAAGLRL